MVPQVTSERCEEAHMGTSRKVLNMYEYVYDAIVEAGVPLN